MYAADRVLDALTGTLLVSTGTPVSYVRLSAICVHIPRCMCPDVCWRMLTYADGDVAQGPAPKPCERTRNIKSFMKSLVMDDEEASTPSTPSAAAALPLPLGTTYVSAYYFVLPYMCIYVSSHYYIYVLLRPDPRRRCLAPASARCEMCPHTTSHTAKKLNTTIYVSS